MEKSRFSEEKIIATLREAEAGMTIRELRRKHSTSDGTYY